MPSKKDRHLAPVPEQSKRGVGYIRVSKMLTEEKLRKPIKRKYKGKARQKLIRVDKISPEVQEERITGEVRRRGWEQGPIFSDLDIPSKAWKRRKKFSELLDELRPGDVLVTVEGSRIARDVYMMSKLYKEEFEDRGIELLALNEQWDTTTAMGKGAMKMNWVWAETEGNQISERVCYAKETSRELGHWQGGIAPLGYDYDERPGYLTINEEEADVVRAIFEAVAAEKSYSSIALCLDNCRILGPNQGHINASSIYRMTHNLTYIGRGEYEGDTFELIGVPPIIDQELWGRVKNAQAKNVAPSKGSPKPKYLLSGLLTCGRCGATMIRRVRYGRETAKNKPGAVDYCCQSAHSPKITGKSCSGVLIRESIASDFIERELFQHLDHTRLERAFSKERGRFLDKRKIDTLERLKERLESQQDKQDKLLEAYGDGAIGKPELARRNKRYVAEIEALEAQIDDAESALVSGRVRASAIRDLGNIEEDWALFNVEEKQKVLRLFVKSVTVFPGRGLDRVHIEWIE